MYILCILSKLDYTWNRIQDKVNKVCYKGKYQQYFYLPILGSYNNWKIVHYIDSRKQHEATNNYINYHIKHNDIRNIDLNLRKDVSNN